MGPQPVLYACHVRLFALSALMTIGEVRPRISAEEPVDSTALVTLYPSYLPDELKREPRKKLASKTNVQCMPSTCIQSTVLRTVLCIRT